MLFLQSTVHLAFDGLITLAFYSARFLPWSPRPDIERKVGPLWVSPVPPYTLNTFAVVQRTFVQVPGTF